MLSWATLLLLFMGVMFLFCSGGMAKAINWLGRVMVSEGLHLAFFIFSSDRRDQVQKTNMRFLVYGYMDGRAVDGHLPSTIFTIH